VDAVVTVRRPVPPLDTVPRVTVITVLGTPLMVAVAAIMVALNTAVFRGLA
jgi:hypothetical protein